MKRKMSRGREEEQNKWNTTPLIAHFNGHERIIGDRYIASRFVIPISMRILGHEVDVFRDPVALLVRN